MRINTSFDVNSVPKEWSVIPCGVFFKEKSIKNIQGEMNLSVYRDYGVIPTDSRDDNHNKVSEDTSNYKLVEPGDFVLNKMKGWAGSLGVSDYRGIVSPSYTVLEPVKKIHNKYFHYLLRSEPYRQMYESLSYGVRIGQWELRYHDFKKIPSLYPPVEEQKLISRYLDKKTEQIDDLVENIQKKIELLKEQRTTLINQCVTKGLDPNVEMKDSGIEWIGEIPSHWDVTKLKFCSTIVNGNAFKSEDFEMDNEIPIIRIGDVKTPFDLKNCMKVNKEIYENNRDFQISRGDILVGMTGGTIGKSALYDLDEIALLNQRVCIFRSLLNSDQTFLSIYMESKLFKEQVTLNSAGGAQPNIGREELMNFNIFLPPLEEQIKIVTQFSSRSEKYQSLLDLEQTRISRLLEYRQSLISSVITGKVRVTEDML